MEISDLIKLWDAPEGHPYKGKLIDLQAYRSDPESISCFCAQGQVLHMIGGWSADRLMLAKQVKADKATAELLGVSRAHAVLLRVVNDGAKGAPAIVLTHPERVLGDQAQTVLAFWRYLDRMTAEQWRAAWDTARDAAWDASQAAAGAAAGAAAWDASRAAAGGAAVAAARAAARAAAWGAARAAAGAAAGAAAWASNEIQGAAVMRAKGQSFYFLPMFGFANPEAILAAERAK